MTDLPQWAVVKAQEVARDVTLHGIFDAHEGPTVEVDERGVQIIARALDDAAKPRWGEPDKTASYVLIAMDDGDVEPGYFDQLYNCWRRHDGSEIKRKVIATMPLPEAPEVV